MGWFGRNKVRPVEESWRRIRTWHENHRPPGTFQLDKGASPKDLDTFEFSIGSPLPDDVRASYALHNGSRQGLFLIYGPPLSLQEARDQRTRLGEARTKGICPNSDEEPLESLRGMKPVHWTPLWIPLTENSGDHVFLDLDPAPGGIRGQIIDFGRAEGPRRLLGQSWSEWPANLADQLDRGKWVYDAAEEVVAPPGYYD
jgi:cell wall assembly regulator SMI1